MSKETITIDGIMYTRTDRTEATESLEYLRNTKLLCEDIIEEIERELENAQALYDDVMHKGLTVNAIEAEGYLRAFHYVKSIIDRSKSFIMGDD